MNLAELAHELRTQDNACTADPIFCVQERKLDVGYDETFGGELVWVGSEGELVTRESDSARFERLDADSFDPDLDGDPDGWTRTSYQERWEFVQPFLTRSAADAYIAHNRHRHSGSLRVYVDSGYRNPEWQALRSLMLSLGEQESGTKK